MTLFLHGLGIGLMFIGSLGLLGFSVYLFWQELRNLR